MKPEPRPGEENTWPYVYVGRAQYRCLKNGWFVRIDGPDAGEEFKRDDKGKFIQRKGGK